MKQVTVNLTDAEYHALATETVDVHEFIENFAKNRARQSIDKHTKKIIKDKLSRGEELSGSKEEIFLKSNIPTLAERESEDPED